MRRIVRMPQLADVHPSDLGFAPSEEVRPSRIDVGEIAFESGDAEEILGYVPDAIAFTNTLGDVRFELIVKDLQRGFFTSALRRLDASRQNAANSVWGRFVWDRAIADRKPRVFRGRALTADGPWMVLGKEGSALAAQDGLAQRPQLRVDLPPHLAQRPSQCAGMLFAKNGAVGVIVNQYQLRAPADRHRKPRGEDYRDTEFEARRPGFAGAKCRPRPVEIADSSRHLSGLVGRVEDAHRIRDPFSERAGPVGHTGMPLMSSLPCARTSSRARLVHDNGVQGNEDLCSLWPALHRTG